ncbi:MAG: hypothetical protein PHQ27_07085, partial [Victivallales bacterium]|nr:hypothetical protein [Victivallales bacterium]
YACHAAAAFELATRLATGLSALAVPGNWDRRRWNWFGPEIWEELFREAGYHFLLNHEYCDRGIRFWGTDDFRCGTPSYRVPARKCFSLVISHNPDAIIPMEEHYASIDLILCGHTHGGQVRIPGLGAIETSSFYWRKFDYGHYRHDHTGTHLIVTSGLGQSGVPFRFFCRPEMVLIRLHYHPAGNIAPNRSATTEAAAK